MRAEVNKLQQVGLVIILSGFIGYVALIHTKFAIILLFTLLFGGFSIALFAEPTIAFLLTPIVVILGPNLDAINTRLPQMGLGLAYLIAIMGLFVLRGIKTVETRDSLRIEVVWIIWVFIGSLSWLVSINTMGTGANIRPYFLIGLAVPFFALLLAHERYVDTRGKVPIAGLLIPITVAALIGLAQFFTPAINSIAFYRAAYVSTNELRLALVFTSGRVLSTMGNPNVLGVLVVFGIILIGQLLRHRHSKRKGTQVLYWLLLFLFLLVLVLTRSRTAFIAAIIALGLGLFPYWLRLKSPAKLLSVIIFVGVGVLYFITLKGVFVQMEGIRTTTLARLDLWHAAIKQWISHPLLGLGPYARVVTATSNINTGPQGTAVDNLYVAVLFNYGLLGALAFYAILAFLGRALWIRRKSLWGAVGWHLFLIFGIINLTGDFLWNCKLAPLFWWVMGLGLASKGRESYEDSNGGKFS